MEKRICIPKNISLRALEKERDRLEKVLLKEFGSYNPSVCWQLLDDELWMQILIRIENSHILFGRVVFSSDALEENTGKYTLRFYSSLPEETFRYSEIKLSEWSIIEKNVADYVFKKIEGDIWISGEIQEEA